MLRIFLTSLLALRVLAAPVADTVADETESIISTVFSDIVPQEQLPSYTIQVTGKGIKDTFLHLAEAEGQAVLQLKSASSATNFIFDQKTQRLSVAEGSDSYFSQLDLYAEDPAPLAFKTLAELDDCLSVNKCRYDIWNLDRFAGYIGVVRQVNPSLYACGDEGKQTIWSGPSQGMEDGCTKVSLKMVV